MRIPARLSLVLFVMFLLISASSAQKSLLEEWGQQIFGAAKFDQLSGVKTDQLEESASKIASDFRFISTYLVLAQAFKGKPVLKELKPEFDASIERVSKAFLQGVAAVQPTGILSELFKVQQETGKVLSEANNAAEFLRWEADVVAPFGIPPGRVLRAVQSQRPLKPEDVDKAKDAVAGLAQKVKSMTPEDIASRVEGLGQIFSGIALGLGDIPRLKRAPVKAVMSLGLGFNEIAEGWGKLFG